MPDICCSQSDPLTDKPARPPPVEIQVLQINETRLRSSLLSRFPQGKEEKALKGPFASHFELQSSSGPDLLNPAELRE